MVRRCRLRNLPPFEKHAIKFGPRTFSGRVLCGTAQSPPFQAQSLLLRLRPRCLLPLLSLRSKLLGNSPLGSSEHTFFRRTKCSVRLGYLQLLSLRSHSVSFSSLILRRRTLLSATLVG